MLGLKMSLIILVSFLFATQATAAETVLDSDWRQVEVSVHARQSSIIVGIGEKELNDTQSAMRCAFRSSSDGGVNWNAPLIHRSADFDWSANPTVFVDKMGTLHAVCMSVKGNYSLGVLEYTRSFDGGKTWVPFRTIVRREKGIPDKPWLSANDSGQLLVTYSDIEIKNMKVVSKVHFVTSFDSGNSWSFPQSVDVPTARTHSMYEGHQGTWIQDLTSKIWGLSFGDYGGGKIFFCSGAGIRNLKTNCASATPVAESKVEVPVTQLFTNQRKSLLGVSWYSAHTLGEVFFALSFDQGKTWREKIKVSSFGSMSSADIDERRNLIRILLTEKMGNRLVTSHRYFSLAGEPISTTLLEEVNPLPKISYFGANQTFVSQDPSHSPHFWISYRSGEQKVQMHTALGPVFRVN